MEGTPNGASGELFLIVSVHARNAWQAGDVDAIYR
jgi:hypothetical protein